MRAISPPARALFALFSMLASLAAPSSLNAAPSIQSIDVQPAPLQVGKAFSVAVTASADATQGITTVDFRPWSARVMRVVLAKQGAIWTGTATVPADLVPPAGVKATVTALMLDAARASATASIKVGVVIPAATGISAVFAGGILTVTGTPQNDAIVVGRNAVGALLVNNGAVTVTGGVPTVANTSLIRILGLAGNDALQVDEGNGALPPTDMVGDLGNDVITGGNRRDTLDGGPGNDTLRGLGDIDVLTGGSGLDILVGGPGDDVQFGGDNDDVFQWSPGDGNDVLEGQGGTDALAFTGSNAGENIDVSANGVRFRVFRNVANVLIDGAGIENLTLHALGGFDGVTVNDLAGTSLTGVRVDLSSSGGPGTGDTATDLVGVNGTAGDDVVVIAKSGSDVAVVGLAAAIVVTGGEVALDTLLVKTLGGADVVDATNAANGGVKVALDGGAGSDVLLGSLGQDTIAGGPSDDIILCNDGDDIVTWNPGDGNDTIEGQAGYDTLFFSASNAGENINVSPNGARVLVFRDVANVQMDCNGLENLELNVFGGADVVTVHDLTGTSLIEVGVDFRSMSGVGDGAADAVIVRGTAGDDVVTVSGDLSAVSLFGLSTSVTITGSEPALDLLTINTLAGDDVLEASALPADLIGLIGDGGDDHDVLIGSNGNDILLGGAGDDVLLGGPGLDVLDGGSGDNILIQ